MGWWTLHWFRFVQCFLGHPVPGALEEEELWAGLSLGDPGLPEGDAEGSPPPIHGMSLGHCLILFVQDFTSEINPFSVYLIADSFYPYFIHTDCFFVCLFNEIVPQKLFPLLKPSCFLAKIGKRKEFSKFIWYMVVTAKDKSACLEDQSPD